MLPGACTSPSVGSAAMFRRPRQPLAALCRVRWYALFITVALTLFSCNRHTIYSHYEPVPACGWQLTDTLHFDVALSPMDRERNGSNGTLEGVLHLSLRTTNDYPYTDLTVTIRQHTRDHRLTSTCRLTLADSEGRTMGRGVNLYQYTFIVPCLPMAPDDTLHVDVSHAMKRFPLRGVIDLGISMSL